MLRRIRGVLITGFLLAMSGLFGGLVPTAHAEDRTVTVATFDEVPYVFTREGVKTGFTIDLLNAIGNENRWNIVFADQPVSNSKGLLKALAAGRADVAATSITITAERLENFDFTQPTLGTGTQIVVAAGRSEPSAPGLKEFLQLLVSKTMAIWIGVALVLSVVPAHIIWLLERRDKKGMVSGSYFPGIFQALRWGLGMLIAANDEEPRRWQSRTMGLVWAFVGIIFVAFYTATLTANLTVEKIEEHVSSLSDLAGRDVCAVNDTTTAKYLTGVGIRFNGASSMDDCFLRLQDGKTDAIVGDAALLEYWTGHAGLGVGRLAGPVLNPDCDGIACRNNDPLCNEIDHALLALRESGQYDVITDKWFGRKDSG